MDNTSPSLILLTYKGKALLMHKQKSVIDEEQHPWCFIGGTREDKESFEDALSRRVEKETGIKIENVEYLSELCYHARLTDDNVNKIQRAENQLLDFFTLKEVRKLFLSSLTVQFISKHSALI
jgi:NADH pyrophosphatase NudC (nudix superfamily)